jgi:hypothetical protein
MSMLDEYGFQLINQVWPVKFLDEKKQTISRSIQQMVQVPEPGDRVVHKTLGSILLNPIQREGPLFAQLLDSPILWDGLREAIGADLVFIPESAFHSDSYGDWHKDTNAQEIAGHIFHDTPLYRVFTVAMYFQDNDQKYGGGLDVIPGSHKFRRRFEYDEGALSYARSLGSVKGDALVFDMRLDHKATWPEETIGKPEKIAVFFSICAPNSGGDLYLRFLKTRPDYSYLNNFTYPEELLQVLARNRIATMDPK